LSLDFMPAQLRLWPLHSSNSLLNKVVDPVSVTKLLAPSFYISLVVLY